MGIFYFGINWKYHFLFFLLEYIMYSSLFPWKQTLKYMSQFVSAVQDFLCVKCVTVFMVQAWFSVYQITSRQLKLDTYMKLFTMLVFIPSIDQWQMQVLQSILSFVRFCTLCWKFIHHIHIMTTSYSHFIDDLCRKYVANKFFSISCNIEYISCNDDL